MGSLDDWKDKGGSIEDEPTKLFWASELDLSKPSVYQASDPQQIKSMEEVLSIIEQGSEADSVVVDTRSSARFNGDVDEPRPGLRRGHMPHALNIPYTKLLNPDNPLQFRDDLEEVIQDAGVDVHGEKPVLVTCGSGATACALIAALAVCGRDPSTTFLYDGSWVEWGLESADNPVVVTPSS